MDDWKRFLTGGSGKNVEPVRLATSATSTATSPINKETSTTSLEGRPYSSSTGTGSDALLLVAQQFPLQQKHHSSTSGLDDADDDSSTLYSSAAPVRKNTRLTQGPIQNPVDYQSFLCGLVAGVVQAGLFNPYDRALYLSIKDRQPFLSWHNWRQPYTGFIQSLGGRALASGLYFPVEHFFLHSLDPHDSSPTKNFLAGTAAGAVNAILLNPLSAIKYKTWGRSVVTEERGNMFRIAYSMAQKSGWSLRPFCNGILPTLYRDVFFGGCYTLLRLQIQVYWDLEPQQQWQANFVAAGLATALSGPCNYARNLQYATSSRRQAATTRQILASLYQEASQVPGTWRSQVSFVLFDRLRIGWGTARVAMGMTVGHAVYDFLHSSPNLLTSTTTLSLSPWLINNHNSSSSSNSITSNSGVEDASADEDQRTRRR